MTRAITALPPAAEVVRDWLLKGNAETGDVRVVDVVGAWDEDSQGEPIVRFLVTLADPRAETWPVEEVLEFHRRLNEKARELDLATAWHVGLQAQTQEEFEPSDLPTA
ncbi:MAG: hypothetical protein H0V05_19285 [Euzebyaceae bacterium]|nr:hypothetical protein [Euzebyaceae bacterium]